MAMTRMWSVWTVAALSAVGMSCGKPAADVQVKVVVDSPRAVTETLLRAMEGKKPDVALTLLPPAELLASSFDCAGGEQMVKKLAEVKATVEREVAQAPAGSALKLGPFDKDGSETILVRRGEELEGCKLKSGQVAVHRAKLDVQAMHDSKSDFLPRRWTFLQFNEEAKWYFFE